MKATLSSLVRLVCIGMIVCASSLHSKTRDGRIAPDRFRTEQLKLAVTVEMDKYELKRQDKSVYRVNIQNSGDVPFYLYKNIAWGGLASLSYVIRDKNGDAVTATVLSDAKDRPPFLEKDFVSLQPKESITVKRWLDVYSEGITKPGKYSLVVFYHTPVSKDSAPPLRSVWTTEYGTVQSQPVEFVVKN